MQKDLCCVVIRNYWDNNRPFSKTDPPESSTDFSYGSRRLWPFKCNSLQQQFPLPINRMNKSLKMKIYYMIIFLIIAFNFNALSQSAVSKEAGFSVLKSKISTFPKFNRELNKILDNDSKVKNVRFVRGDNSNTSPAWAQSNDGTIIFDLYFIENQVPTYDDNRLVVILYHELGHLYDNVSRTEAEREEQAFRFSVIKLRQLAENGDCEPLSTGLKFMKLRSSNDNFTDAHTIGLKTFIKSELFIDNEMYVENGCKDPQEVLIKKASRDLLIQDLKNEFRIVSDLLNSRELYYHSNTPKSERSYFFVYVSKRTDGQVVLRLRIQYDGRPIMVKGYSVKTDSREIIISPQSGFSIVRGQNVNKNYSYCDFPVNRFTYKAILDILDSKNPEITYLGNTENESRRLNEKELDALKKTLQIYELLGGDNDFSN
jgi:hypothetical protein